MVAIAKVRASNALVTDATAPRVAVFVGGTSGIGQLTLRALVETGASARIYLVGRASAAERTRTFIQELAAVNARAEIVWLEGEVSLLAEARRICDVISGKEARVDLLFLTAGYAPFGPRVETSEGLEVAQSLEHYSRLLFASRLMPLLRVSEHGRVVSVLAGGWETTALNVDDIDLKKPGSFSGARGQLQYVPLHSVALEQLAAENPDVVFIHSHPGIVSTGNVRRGHDPNSFVAWLIAVIVEPLFDLFGIRQEVSAQRHLFQSTSAAFGGHGVPWSGKPGVNTRGGQEGGLFLVSYRSDCTPNVKVMAQLREKAGDKVWKHTQEILGPYLN